MEKGTYRYIEHYKKKKLVIAALFLALIAGSVLVIWCIFNTRNTYWTVIPVILSLPFAKYAVAYIVVSGCRSMSEAEYDRVRTFAGAYQNMLAVYDVTLFSERGTSFLQMLLIVDDSIYGYRAASDKKFSNQDIETYLRQLTKNAGYDVNVACYDDLEDVLSATAAHMEALSDANDLSKKRLDGIKKAILAMGV